MLSVLRLWRSGVQLETGLSPGPGFMVMVSPGLSSPAPVPWRSDRILYYYTGYSITVLSRIQSELAVSEIIESSESPGE